MSMDPLDHHKTGVKQAQTVTVRRVLQSTNEEDEASQGELTFPRPPSSQEAEPGVNPDSEHVQRLTAWVWCPIVLGVTFSVSKVSTWMPLGYLKKGETIRHH